MATNVSDLVESCATVLLARTRHLDDVRLPRNPLDVLAQHLVSMGCTAHWSRDEAFALVRSAYPFRDLERADFDAVLDYLTGGGESLRRQYAEVFGKIELDDEGFRTRDGKVRREFLQNIGVIPDVGQVRVRTNRQSIGSVEESFIRQLKIGDIFVLAGRPVRLEKVSQMEAWVSRADGALPTVPRWNANKLPLSNRVAQEINSFRGELRTALEAKREKLVEWIAERLDCGRANAEIILKIHLVQHEFSEIPTADFLLVEELNDEKERAVHYFFHSLIGRASNDAVARIVTQRLSKLRGGNAVATPHDYGFVLSVERRQRFTEEEIPTLLSPKDCERALDESLRQSEMLKYHFRNAAQTGLMVYRNFFNQQKSVRKLQWSSEVIFNVLQQYEPDHVLMREARRDSLHVYIDAEGAQEFLIAQASRPVRLRQLPRVLPLSFAMYATKIKEALLVEDPYETMERLYHQWWSEIEDGSKPV
jgi:ATP-dependent Lhr-like helicase